MKCSSKEQNLESNIIVLHKHRKRRHSSIQCKNFVQKRTKLIHEDYSILNLIGIGSYGSVRKALHKITRTVRAIKSIKKDSRANSSQIDSKIYTELEILKSLDHPNIVKLYEYYEDERHFHLITEYIKGGHLFKYLSNHETLSERTAAHFMLQLLRAVNYCHKKNICHRDLKPENLVLERQAHDSNLKVIDFGLAHTYDPHSKLTQKLGTATYVAPEVIRGCYDLKCDIWSCGVIMYQLISGRLPFRGKDNSEVLSKVITGQYSLSFKEFRTVSYEAKDMIIAMLTYDPAQRPTAEELLAHAWIIQNNYENSPATAYCKSSINKLRSFSAKMKLQQAVMTFIASHVMMNQDHPHYLIDFFRKLDKDQDGKISREELKTEFYKVLDPKEAEMEVDKIMLESGCTGDFLEYTNFLAGTTDKSTLITPTNLEAAFRMLDLDGDGSISEGELRSVFKLEDQEAENELLSDLNKSGKHKLDIERFKNIMLKII